MTIVKTRKGASAVVTVREGNPDAISLIRSRACMKGATDLIAKVSVQRGCRR
jgi:hypothetical protein